MEAVFSAVIAIVGAVFSVGVSYGMLQTKIPSMKEEMVRMQTEILELRETCVRKDYLHAITEPLQRHIQEIQADIKEILRVLSRE